MYGTPSQEGTVTSSAQNIESAKLGTNTDSSVGKEPEPSYTSTAMGAPASEQPTETSRTLPGTMISHPKEEDDASCLSIKSGKMGPYAGGADTPPIGETSQTTTTEEAAQKSTMDKLKEKVTGKSTETSSTEPTILK